MTQTVGKVYMVPGNVNERLSGGQSYLHKVIHDRKEIGWVGALLDHGANPNALSDDGVSSLLLAAAMNQPEVVKILLARGADKNAHQYKGYTPLRTAAAGGFLEVVKILLEHDADTTIADTLEGLTPLGVAKSNGHAEVVALLQSAGPVPQRAASASAVPPLRQAPAVPRPPPASPKPWWRFW